MNISRFVLSAIERFRGNVGSEILRRFVQVVAPLSLRKSRCIGHRALAHNKSNQFAPVGACRRRTQPAAAPLFEALVLLRCQDENNNNIACSTFPIRYGSGAPGKIECSRLP